MTSEGYCKLLPNLKLAGHCYDAIEALDFLRKHSIDLLFLDLNMPKLKGFDFLRTLKKPPKIIVTTAYQEHALEGYELDIVDYLLKPFDFQRFLKAINKVAIDNTMAISDAEPKAESDFFVKSGKQHVHVEIAKILYLEASGNYTKIVTIDGPILVREKISQLIQELNWKDLIQVHKSFAVAKKHIKRIEGNQIWMADQVVPIGKTYRSTINELLGVGKQ